MPRIITNSSRLSWIIILVSVLLFSSCNSHFTQDKSFKSNFYSNSPQTWIGPEYWSNPLQDWQIVDGELQCFITNKNRNVHLLTRKLDSIKGDLKMSVDLKVFHLLKNDSISWLGFEIGAKGKFNDYRDDAVFGRGIKAGITNNGNLFVGEIAENLINVEIQQTMTKGVVLEVTLTPQEKAYTIKLALFTRNNTKPIQEFQLDIIDDHNFAGDLVLVSDYKLERGDPIINSKSVAFSNWQLSGSKLLSNDDYMFGPIMFSQYTLSRGTLKLTAQMAPIESSEKVSFQVKEKDSWITIREAEIDTDARTATFKFEQWHHLLDVPYRLAFKLDRGAKEKDAFYWQGIIRKDPIDKDEIVIAGFTGNDHLGFPNTDIVEQVKFHNPDVLFFSGDQIYEPNGGYGAQRSPIDKATLDYLRKWYLYGWAFRDLMKDRPTVSITDDHDVYHGNIWGAGGIATPAEFGQGAKAQDAGGYKMPARWVKMVERSQTSHLPDPFDPTPVAQGIGTYYTDMVYGGISFAILEDRKFKSAPKGLLPDAKIANGWRQNKDFDMIKDGDVPGAKLLGDRQMLFLDHWATDWSYQSEMKVLLSQTIFANVATLPKEAMSGAIIPTLRILHKGDYPPDDKPVSDLDSNGWPQSGRNKAVATIRKGFAFHLAGDQHLGSTIQYGLDDWNDSGFAFCVPSISNHWPRRWYPTEGGRNRDPQKPKYTGENTDGFGNKITVHAASNPLFTGKEPARLYDRAAGYGIVRLNKVSRMIRIECWPRQANPQLGDEEQYDGWPIQITQESNYGKEEAAYLPEITIDGIEKPVVYIINEESEEIMYAIRLNSNKFIPKIFDTRLTYKIKVGEPDTNNWQSESGIVPGGPDIKFQF